MELLIATSHPAWCSLTILLVGTRGELGKCNAMELALAQTFMLVIQLARQCGSLDGMVNKCRSADSPR